MSLFNDLIAEHDGSLSTVNKLMRAYKRRQVLFYEGTQALGVYCVQSGQIKIYKTSAEGKQHIFKIAGSGSVLGLEWLFAGDQYGTTTEMLEDGSVCFIEKAKVLEMIGRNSKICRQVMESLALDLEASELERVELAQNSVRERMARLLSILSQSHGTPAAHNGIRISLPLSREEMAEMIGTAAETAMRLLKEFKDEHLVEVAGREIIILDRDRLGKVASLGPLT